MISAKEPAIIFKSAVSPGSESVLKNSGLPGKRLRMSEAYALYGRDNVDRWIREGLIEAVRGFGEISGKSIERNSLEAVASKSSRISYLLVAERRVL